MNLKLDNREKDLRSILTETFLNCECFDNNYWNFLGLEAKKLKILQVRKILKSEI